MTRVRVPGKVLLAGEYAVLLPGEPCLVVAVDRYLDVEAAPSPVWRASTDEASWRDGEPVPQALSFVVEAISAVRQRWPDVTPRMLRTRDRLKEGGSKLGLGGSAAATVGAVFAAAQDVGATREDLWALADEVHRRLQGGRGSGADVAACIHGGVLRYVQTPRTAQVVSVHPEVRFILVWTGESAKTAPRLPLFEAFASGHPGRARLFAKLSRDAVDLLAQGLSKGHLALIREAMAQARAALRGLESALGIELETPALAAAVEVARAEGAAGKLSGAGGGDCAVVIAVGDAHAQAVREALLAARPEPLAVAMSGGVDVERD